MTPRRRPTWSRHHQRETPVRERHPPGTSRQCWGNGCPPRKGREWRGQWSWHHSSFAPSPARAPGMACPGLCRQLRLSASLAPTLTQRLRTGCPFALHVPSRARGAPAGSVANSTKTPTAPRNVSAALVPAALQPQRGQVISPGSAEGALTLWCHNYPEGPLILGASPQGLGTTASPAYLDNSG